MNNKTKEKTKKWYKGYIDAMFKAIFCNAKNRKLLKWFIEWCLNKKVEIIEVYPPEIIKPNIYVKNKTLDVLLIVDGEMVNLEINSGYYNGLHIRNAGYIFSKYAEVVKVGEVYKKMTNFIQINFTKDLPKDYPLVGEYYIIDEKTEIKYVDNFKIIEYNIDKIFDECYKKGKKEYNFVAILNASKEELDKLCVDDEFLVEYKKEVMRMNENIKFTTWISEEEDAEKVTNTLIHNAKEDGESIGLKKGEKIGEKNKAIEIAQSLI